MAATPSNMLPLGTIAPDFNLPDTVTGKQFSLQDLKGEQGSIVMFICNHCPYVLHVKQQLIAIAQQYATLGIATIAISSNDIENYPQDAPDKMKAMMDEWGNPFAAYLEGWMALRRKTMYRYLAKICAMHWIVCWPSNRLIQSKFLA